MQATRTNFKINVCRARFVCSIESITDGMKTDAGRCTRAKPWESNDREGGERSEEAEGNACRQHMRNRTMLPMMNEFNVLRSGQHSRARA